MFYHVCLIEAELLKLSSIITRLKECIQKALCSSLNKSWNKLSPWNICMKRKLIYVSGVSTHFQFGRLHQDFMFTLSSKSSSLSSISSCRRFHSYSTWTCGFSFPALAWESWNNKNSHWHTCSSFSVPEVSSVLASNY